MRDRLAPARTRVATNGRVSFWWDQLGAAGPTRPALGGDLDVDVCIVGGGYTGLWTAYYLKGLEPDLRVVVLEARFAGFGASGRNGGWLTNSVTGGREQYVRTHGRAAAVAHQLALNETVEEVIRVVHAEGIDAEAVKGGEVTVATSAAQLGRLTALAKSEQAWPGTDVQLLGAAEMRSRIDVSRALGGLWHPHCARIQPARLVRGLAEAAERRGAVILEQTRVDRIEPGRAVTPAGTVRAAYVIRATEGFTALMRAEHRRWLPMNSSMVVTAPLTDDQWAAIGWDGCETLGDAAHVYMYAQRTGDGRIAFGGRGVPYRYGSRVDSDGATHQRTVDALADLLHRFFPSLAQVPIDHAWSGVLGVPRDWSATVSFDRATGLGAAGGYVGTGVTATNLAGRTLADLVLGRDTDLVRLPWVNHRAGRWEPEPLRWLAVNAIYAAYRAADRAEDRGRPTTAPVARVADVVSGRSH